MPAPLWIILVGLLLTGLVLTLFWLASDERGQF